MKMTINKIVLAGLVAVGLIGCGDTGASEVSPSEDKAVRNNFSRELTPEEVKAMGGNSAQTQGAAPPAKSKG